MKASHVILGSILAFVSINAILAGVLFLIDPSGVKMGLNLDEISKNSLFKLLHSRNNSTSC